MRVSQSDSVVTDLGNGNTRARSLANLTDLAACAANDTANHIRWDADVLSLDFLSVLVVSGWSSAAHVRIRSTLEAARCRSVAEVSTVASAHDTGWSTVFAPACGVAAHATGQGTAARLSADRRIVENSTCATLPVVHQALADLPDGALDTLRRSLHLHDSLGRLGKHFLLRHHAHA